MAVSQKQHHDTTNTKRQSRVAERCFLPSHTPPQHKSSEPSWRTAEGLGRDDAGGQLGNGHLRSYGVPGLSVELGSRVLHWKPLISRALARLHVGLRQVCHPAVRVLSSAPAQETKHMLRAPMTPAFICTSSLARSFSIPALETLADQTEEAAAALSLGVLEKWRNLPNISDAQEVQVFCARRGAPLAGARRPAKVYMHRLTARKRLPEGRHTGSLSSDKPSEHASGYLRLCLMIRHM